MPGISSPCKGCESRTATCHGTCSEYLAWQQALAVEKEKTKVTRFAEIMQRAFRYEQICKARKRKRIYK